MIAEIAVFSHLWKQLGGRSRCAETHATIKILLIALVSVSLAFPSPVAGANTETILHTFTTGQPKHGLTTLSGVVIDKAGIIYGTTFDGGDFGKGTIYQLKLLMTGKWAYKLIHSFANDGQDGIGPGTNLILDNDGNLYGSTAYGGTGRGCNAQGCGTVFKLARKGTTWIETVLYSFQGGPDGFDPYNLTFDSQGNLYSTTLGGGTGPCVTQQSTGCGTVFELSPSPDGSWSKTTLYSFQGLKEGQYPIFGVVMDSSGNLYGVTLDGGLGVSPCTDNGFTGCGTAFALTHSGNSWTHSVLYSFKTGNDGQWPSTSLVFDKQGNLFGMTHAGGGVLGGGGVICPIGCGAAFELSPAGGGSWTESVIHGFTGVEGAGCEGALTVDSAGNLYGTCEAGGLTNNPVGTVFKLTKSGKAWSTAVLHNFTDAPSDGSAPLNGVVFDNAGNLYGTTLFGGLTKSKFASGTVFKITP